MAKRSGMSIDFGSGKERGCGMKRKNGLITGVLLAIFMVSIFLMGCKQESDLEHLQKETDSGGRIGEISEEGTAHVIEGGESEQETEPGEGQAITFPEHFSETIGNVTFHMDIVAGEDLTDAFVVTAKAQMQKVNQEKAFELFYSDITAYDTHDYEEEDEYGKMAHSVTFVSPEETTLSYGPASGKLEYMERDLMPYVRNAFVTFEDAREIHAPVQAVVSREGIEWLNIEKVFAFSEEKGGVSLADMEAIVQTAANKFNQVLGDTAYEITGARLYYYVDLSSGMGIYDVKPAWILSGNEKGGKKMQMIIDAQTAEEILRLRGISYVTECSTGYCRAFCPCGRLICLCTCPIGCSCWRRRRFCIILRIMYWKGFSPAG